MQKENICAVITSLILSIIFTFRSPSHPWVNSDILTDSAVFKTISMMMARGYMPYRDSFDHKGPLLYILNWLGDRIYANFGIIVIEIIFLSVTFYMIYKMARLSCRIFPAFVVSMVSISLLFSYYSGGNYTEEYAMPFIAISTYIFLDYFKNNKITVVRLLLCGFTFAATFLLRPNMIALWFVMCLSVLVKLLRVKDIRGLFKYLLYFLIGSSIIIVPIFLWLVLNGALGPCISCYFIFNSAYTSPAISNNHQAGLGSKISSLLYFLNNTVIIISYLCQLFTCAGKKGQSFFDISYLIYMILNLILISISGANYDHYALIMIPMLSYPLSQLFSTIDRIDDRTTSRCINSLVCLYALSVIALPNWFTLMQQIPSIYASRNENHISQTATDICNKIDSLNVSEEEPISVYGNWDKIYILTKRPHATRYSYQYPIGLVKTELMDDYFTQLDEQQPKIIVVQEGSYDDFMKSFVTENGYSCVYGQTDSIDSALLFYKE